MHMCVILYFRTLAAATSVKSKRYYFGQLKINSSLITLSMITTSQLSPELRQLKKTMSIPLIRFEDAKVSLGKNIKNFIIILFCLL